MTVGEPRTRRFCVRAAMLLALAGALAGCAGGGASGPANSFASMGNGATVAFESIDGPPPQVFDRMVGVLDAESQQRNIAVVSRQGSAAYRVRGYLAAQISRGRTSIAWVWDVYDANQQRAVRLSGTEPAGKIGRDTGRDAWASADETVLRRIAQAGLSGISALMSGTPAPAETPVTEPEPPLRGPAVASADEPPADAPGRALGFSAR